MDPLPPPVAYPPQISQGASVVVVAVVDPAPDLLQLAPGTLLEGTVRSDTRSATVSVDSAFGNFTLKSGLGLVKGATLTLQVTGQGGQFQFRLMAINGQPLAPGIPGASGPSLGGMPTAVAVMGGPGLGLEQPLPVGWGDAVALGGSAGRPAPVAMSASPLSGPASPMPQGGILGMVVRGIPLSPDGTLPSPAQALITGTQVVVRIASLQMPSPVPQIMEIPHPPPADVCPGNSARRAFACAYARPVSDPVFAGRIPGCLCISTRRWTGGACGWRTRDFLRTASPWSG
ncbi:MAG: hypothetical protein ABT940_05495 [Alphaproteobacteria bacterium]